MSTLKEISMLTNVSISTVSRILNNDTTLSVTDATRTKVLSIAKSLDYKTIGERYNSKKLNKYKVGIAQMFELKEQEKDVYYILMKKTLEEICKEKGIATVTLFRNQEKNFTKLSPQKLSGIFPIGRFTLEEIKDFEIYTKNIVFLDSSPDELMYNSIIPDYQLGIKLALKNFLDNGHKNIGFIGSKYTFGNTKDMEVDSRYIFFKSYLENNGILNEEYFIECEMNSISGYYSMKKFLKQKRLPTAFFISSDAIAPGILRALKEKK